MEYKYYLEQKYIIETGTVQCRLLSADEAESFGYEDGFFGTVDGFRTYVDGFDSISAAKCHIESLYGAVFTNESEVIG